MSEDAVQLLVLVIIGVVYGSVTVLKKANAWINRQRMKRPALERTPPPRSETVRASETPIRRREQERPPRKDRKITLLEELAKALTGRLQLEPEEEPEIGPLPEFTPPPPPRPISKPAVVRPPATRRAEPRKKGRAAAEATEDVRVTASGVRMHDVAIVHQSQMRHLAILRTRKDIQRGILAHEILGPPRARRPLRFRAGGTRQP